MASLFTRIVQGEIPCHKIYEDEVALAFLDIRPLNPGHTLVIPKQEVDYLFDLEDGLLQHLALVSKKVARAIDRAVPCERVGLIVAGLEVPHAHIHLVPINGIGDINFARARDAEQADLAATAEKIRAALATG